MVDVPEPAHVEPGGPGWTGELGNATVHKFSVSEMDNNVYLVRCTGTGAQVLIDAADDADRIDAAVADSGSGVDLIVTTHRHWDHHRALPQVAGATGATTAAGREDADELPVRPDRLLDHGDTLAVGDLQLQVLALRGHTPGSIALALTDARGGSHLFTGDSLFPGGPGKTADATDFASLLADLETRVFAVYPDDTMVHPGHGDSTTLGAERPQLPEWRARGW